MSVRAGRHVMYALLPPVVLAQGCFVAGLVAVLLLARRAGMRVYALLTLPGTLAHELSHYLVALVLGLRPSGLCAIPVEQADGTWRLGQVTLDGAKPLRASVAALAPLLLLAPAGYCTWRAAQSTLPASLLWNLGAAELLMTSLPSWQDLRVALPGLTLVLLVGLLVWRGWPQ